MKFLIAFLRALFPFLFFKSNLQPFSLAENFAFGFVNPFPNGRFQYFGRTNGASRNRKSNRLHLSRKTKNKHR